MTAAKAAAWLRARADSYGRDAVVLHGDPDQSMRAMGVAFTTIRDELRKCADEITEASEPNQLVPLFDGPDAA
jgi:hypothetical protein